MYTTDMKHLFIEKLYVILRTSMHEDVMRKHKKFQLILYTSDMALLLVVKLHVMLRTSIYESNKAINKDE